MTAYAFATKTLFDPVKGISIRSFQSKTEYLNVAPIKALSFVLNDPNAGLLCRSATTETAARDMVGLGFKLGSPDDVLVTHTDFHEQAIKQRLGMFMQGKVVYIDELARQHNPALRSISLDKLAAIYGEGEFQQRLPCDFVEGNHTTDALVAANERDATLMLLIYLKLTTGKGF